MSILSFSMESNLVEWKPSPHRKYLIRHAGTIKINSSMTSHPTSRAKNLNAITEEEAAYPTPKPSIKHVTTNELPLLQETNPYEGTEEFNPLNEDGASYDLIALHYHYQQDCRRAGSWYSTDEVKKSLAYSKFMSMHILRKMPNRQS